MYFKKQKPQFNYKLYYIASSIVLIFLYSLYTISNNKTYKLIIEMQENQIIKNESQINKLQRNIDSLKLYKHIDTVYIKVPTKPIKKNIIKDTTNVL